MKLRVNTKFSFFFIPLLIILLQFARIGGLNVSWLLYIIMFLQVIIHYRIVMRSASLTLLTGAIVVWPLISQLWSISKGFQGNVYFSIITGLVVALYICTLDNDAFAHFSKGVFFACVVFMGIGLYEMLLGRYMLVTDSIFMVRLNINRLHYPIVAFANPNDLGQFLALLLPISTVFLLERTNTIGYRIIIIFCNVIGGYLIFNTESNLSMIVFLGTYVIYFFASKKRINKSNVIYWMLFLLVLIIVFVAVENRTHIIERIAANVLFVETDDIHFIKRSNLYSSLIESIFKHPFGGFGNAYSITEPHNLFLYVFSDYGFLGGALFVVWYVSLIRQTIIRLKRNAASNMDYILLAGIILFVVSSSISSGNEQRKAIWIFLGIHMYYHYLSINKNVVAYNETK